MTIDIKTPIFPESIADGVIAKWHKNAGDFVLRDEVLAEIETDKVVLEVPAPQDGILTSVLKQEGEMVLSAEVLAIFTPGNTAANTTDASNEMAVSAAEPTLTAPAIPLNNTPSIDFNHSPSVRVALVEHGVDASSVHGTGRDGRLTKQDVLAQLQQNLQEDSIIADTPDVVALKVNDPIITEPAVNSPLVTTTIASVVSDAGIDSASQTSISPATVQPIATLPTVPTTPTTPMVVDSLMTEHQAISTAVGERITKRVPMTRLRSKVAERLLAATQQTAMLTTFNEVNMKPIMDMRRDYGDRFEKRHGVRLGFMSLFAKASSEALKRFPAVNASIEGNDIVYHGYFDIGVAVSSDRGLVVPVIRNVDQMSFSEVEKQIADFGKKGRDGKLSIEEMMGGTFTITNGGVFGSLLSTPIINPPQTAILGMHKIQDRPMAVDGQVVILPMMYLALSYDHRLIDGKEAVQFLATIKALVEDPSMLLLDL